MCLHLNSVIQYWQLVSQWRDVFNMVNIRMGALCAYQVNLFTDMSLEYLVSHGPCSTGSGFSGRVRLCVCLPCN